MCDNLLLFNISQSHLSVHKVLLLYILIELNITRGSLTNANKLLDKLDREIDCVIKLKLNYEKIYLKAQLLFLIEHELQHAYYEFNETLRMTDITRVEQRIRELYDAPRTFRQKQVFKLIMEICNEERRLEELSCDAGGIHSIGGYIKNNYRVEEVPVICTQLLRLVTMLQYVINIHELAEFRVRDIALYTKKHVFDVVRVGNIAMALINIFNEGAVGNLDKELQNEVYKYNDILVNSLKIGLADLWILHTSQINLEKDSSENYDAVCFRFLEASKNINECLTSHKMFIL